MRLHSVNRVFETVLANSDDVDDPTGESIHCDVCNCECGSEPLLEQHKQKYHQKFLAIETNPDSNMLIHNSGDLVLQTTDIITNSEEIVDDPTTVYIEMQSLKCDLCSYECDSELLLEQHKQLYHQTVMVLLTHPDSDVDDQSANLVFHTTDILANSEAAIEIPTSECTVIQSLKCDLCDYECDTEVLLEEHKQAYHQTVMTIVTNPDSGIHTQTGDIIFQTNDILESSEAAGAAGPTPECIGTQPFKCDLCDIVCDSALILKQHRSIFHQTMLTIAPNPDNDMQTDFENLIFQTNDNLVNSEPAIDGPPPECTEIQSFRCDLCDYECDSEVLLEQHKQMYHQSSEIIHINPDGTSYLKVKKTTLTSTVRRLSTLVQSIPGFQECDEDVETWTVSDAEDCGFQMLNDDEIVTSMQEDSDPIDDETDEDEDINYESSKGPSNADTFSAL
ncbi:uncharacterized protein TNCV_272651 [Trichonephila clavipes]|nr:uncharacterized protein TNCV_272651 [Trichonephila clavipes]